MIYYVARQICKGTTDYLNKFDAKYGAWFSGRGAAMMFDDPPSAIEAARRLQRGLPLCDGHPVRYVVEAIKPSMARHHYYGGTVIEID